MKIYYLFLCFYNVMSFFQVIDELSFNLRDYRQVPTIYNHYKRNGDIVIFKNFLSLTPKLNNTSSILYSEHQINSELVEYHIDFRIQPEKKYGSAFAIFFFKNDLSVFLNNSTRNQTFLGFPENYDGIGVFFVTRPKEFAEHSTDIYIKHNDGSDIPQNFGFKELTMYNSCSVKTKGKLQFVKIVFNENEISVYIKDDESLNFPCLKNIKRVVKPPYRIAISTFNGIMNDENYLDSIQIHKITVINSDFYKKKNKFIILNNNEINFELEKTTNFVSKDLISNNDSIISNETLTLSNYNITSSDTSFTADHTFFMKNLDKTLDLIIEKISLTSNAVKHSDKEIDNLFSKDEEKALRLLESSSGKIDDFETSFNQLLENIQMLSEINSYYKSDTSLKNEDYMAIIDSLKNTKTMLSSKYSQLNLKDNDKYKDFIIKINEKLSLITNSEKLLVSKTNHIREILASTKKSINSNINVNPFISYLSMIVLTLVIFLMILLSKTVNKIINKEKNI